MGLASEKHEPWLDRSTISHRTQNSTRLLSSTQLSDRSPPPRFDPDSHPLSWQEWAPDHPHAPTHPTRQHAQRTEQQERRDRIAGALAAFTITSPVKAQFPTALKRCPRPAPPRSSAVGDADGSVARGVGGRWDRTARVQRGLDLQREEPLPENRPAANSGQRRANVAAATSADASVPDTKGDAPLIPGRARSAGMAGGWARVLLAVWLAGCAGWWGRGLSGVVARAARVGGGGGGWGGLRRRGGGHGGAVALAAVGAHPTLLILSLSDLRWAVEPFFGASSLSEKGTT